MLVDTGLIAPLKPKDSTEALRRKQKDKKRTRRVDQSQEAGTLHNRPAPAPEPNPGLDRYV